jgi:AcrR family transcriptional regulator
VFIALLNTWLGTLDAQLTAGRVQDVSVPQQVAAMAAGVDEIYRVAGRNWNILLEFWAKAKTDPAVAGSMVEMLRRYQEFFQQMLERGEAEGSVRVGDVPLAATLLLSVVLGLLLQGILDPEGRDWCATMQHTLAMLMATMGGRVS